MSLTKIFADNFNKNHNFFAISKWVHDYPTTVKVTRLASVLLGITAIASIPFFLPIVGAAVACGIGITGGMLLLGSLVSWIFLKYVTCNAYDMGKRSFQKAECPGGRLYYQGDIPILELTDDSSETGAMPGYKQGFAHGYLLGSHIYELKKNLDIALHSVMRLPRAFKVTRMLEEMRRQIPEAYKQELRGLAEGYNRWAEKAHVATSMNEDDVLLVHLIADSKYFSTKGALDLPSPRIGAKLTQYIKDMAEKFSRPIAHQVEHSDLSGGMACTTLVSRDPVLGAIAGRNMDWCPFGKGGTKSLVIVWKPQNIAVVGIPGLIGAITGWNRDRLCLSMNVCPGKTKQVRGMPSAFFNRRILELSHSVSDAITWTKKVRPLGPFHLILADSTAAGACISLYQGENESDHIRFLQDDEPLVTLNCRYPEGTGGYFNSQKRAILLDRYFQKAKSIPKQSRDWKELIANALKLTPLVNSWITLHSLLFVPKSDEAWISWDNGYAGSAHKKLITMSEVFSQ